MKGIANGRKTYEDIHKYKSQTNANSSVDNYVNVTTWLIVSWHVVGCVIR